MRPTLPVYPSPFYAHESVMAPFTYFALALALVSSALAAPTNVSLEGLDKRDASHTGRVRLAFTGGAFSDAYQNETPFRAHSSRSASGRAAR